MSNKRRDWTKAQPYHAKTGRITTRTFDTRRPNQVEWVRSKGNKR